MLTGFLSVENTRDSNSLQETLAQGANASEANNSAQFASDSIVNVSDGSSSQTISNPSIPQIVTAQNNSQSVFFDETGNLETTPPAETDNETAHIEKGLNYLSLYHMYSSNITTDAILNRDFSKFRADGITVISLSLYWYRLEGSVEGDYDGVYRNGNAKSYYGNWFLNDVKRVIQVANVHNIKVLVTFHTLWGGDGTWCTPSYVVDPVTGLNVGLAIVRSLEMRQAFINMFNHTVSYLARTPGIWAWAILNEPWYWGRTGTEHDFITNNGQTQKENFITLIQTLSGIVKAIDGRPVTIRFSNIHENRDENGTVTSLKNIFTSDWGWDQRIFDALDFIGINAYQYEEPTETLQTTWLNMTTQNVLGCASRNKQVWITEFGGSGSNDDDVTQANDYGKAISTYQNLPIKGLIAWFWRGDSPNNNPGLPGTGYNLCANATTGEPRPAYSELTGSS